MGYLDSVELIMRQVRDLYPEMQLLEAKFLTESITDGELFRFLCPAKLQNKSKVVAADKPIKVKRHSEVTLIVTSKRFYVLNRELSFLFDLENLQMHFSDQIEFQAEVAIWDSKISGIGEDFIWPSDSRFLTMNIDDFYQIEKILNQKS